MYFRPFEFQCCCRHECGKGFAQMDMAFLNKLEFARMISGVPYKLSSAFRCPEHNKDVGGSEDSSHLKGFAVDIKTPDSRTRFKVLYGLIKAGFTRIGVYETFIHVDDDPDKAPEVSWFNS